MKKQSKTICIKAVRYGRCNLGEADDAFSRLHERAQATVINQLICDDDKCDSLCCKGCRPVKITLELIR